MSIQTPLVPGNMKLNVREVIDDGSGPVTRFYATYPQHRLAINIDKLGESAKVEVTTDGLLNDGSKLVEASLSGSSISWVEVSASGTDNYFAGDSHLITGIKVTALVASQVQVTLSQVNE